MIAEYNAYTIEPIDEKYVWRICDLMVANADRFKRYFPQTLAQNLNPELSQLFVNKKVKQFERKEELLFILKDKKSKKIFGLIYIKELNWKTKEAELAYCVGYTHEGKGITTEAVRSLSSYAFNNLSLSTLRIIVHKSNLSSIRVAEKCGYLWKLTLKNEHTPPGEAPLDMELYELKASNA